MTRQRGRISHKKIGKARNLPKRLGLSCKSYMYMIFPNKIKNKKKISRYLVYSKKFVHTNLKELNFTGMKLRGCLASFFTFSGELNFAND